MTAFPPRRMTVAEVAAILGIARATLYKRLVAKESGNPHGRITESALADTPPMRRVGRRWMIWGPVFEDWMTRRENGLP